MFAKPLITALGIAGLLPFMAALLASVMDKIIGDIALAVEPDLIFVLYSSVILSFLCGALWGRLLSQDCSIKVACLLVATNLLALASWLSLLMIKKDNVLSLALLSLGYLLVFSLEYIEVDLLYKKVYRAYLKLRFWLTFLVVAMHLIMLASTISSRV